MKGWIQQLGVISVISTLVACSTTQNSQQLAQLIQQAPTAAGTVSAKWLFNPVEVKNRLSAVLPATWVKRQRLVSLNTEYLPHLSQSYAISNLDFNLFDDVMLRSEQLQRRVNGDQIIWSGVLSQNPSSLITLVIEQGQLFGSIFDGEHRYEIQGLNNGLHRISEIDSSQMPVDEVTRQEPIAMPNAVLATAPEKSIDVMVVYTAQTQQQYPDIQSRIALAIEQTNASLLFSGSPVLLRLVHQGRVDYASSGDLTQDLAVLQNKNDGKLDELHAWRDKFGADLVSLWVPSSHRQCSSSYQMMDIVPAFESLAFNVINTACATQGLSFSQAIGRTLGLGDQNRQEEGAYSFSHAYMNDKLATLMAQAPRCGDRPCVRLPYFSNPRLQLGSAQLGENQADNVQTMQQSFEVVSAFRSSQFAYPTRGEIITNIVAEHQTSYAMTRGFEQSKALFGTDSSNDKVRQQQAELTAAFAAMPTPKWVKRSRIVEILPEQLPTTLNSAGQSSTTLSLNLFEDVNMLAEQTELTFRASQDASWQGRLTDEPLSAVNLVINGDDVMGVIHTAQRIFEIEPLSGHFHRITELEPSLMPADHPPVHDMPMQAAEEADSSSQAGFMSEAQAREAAQSGMTGSEPMIDMMIIYEKKSREEYESQGYGATYWPQKLQLQVDVLNTVLAYSHAIPRVRLVHVHEVDYASTSNAYTELGHLYNTSDGFLDEVPALRAKYGADIVSMVMDSMDSYCGLGYRPTSAYATNNYRLGLNVISRSCMDGLTFAHEFGHNVGMNHDRVVSGVCSNSSYTNQILCQNNGFQWTLNSGILPNNFGYVDKVNTFRTVMSYATECSNYGLYCNRVFFYSSPDNSTSDGIVLGSTEANNLNVINSTYPEMLNYSAEQPSQYQSVNLVGNFNNQSTSDSNGRLTYQGHYRWQGDVAFTRGTNSVRFVTQGADQAQWGQSNASIQPVTEGEIFNGLLSQNANDIVLTIEQCGIYAVTFDESGMYSIEFKQKNNTPVCQDDWRRTVIFIQGQTVSGQDMFIRGGIDHTYAINQLGKSCAPSGVAATLANSSDCAIAIRHNNMLNGTTFKWKIGELYLDWYGLESTQGKEYLAVSPYVIEYSNNAQGTALDWTTNAWPSSWGTKRTVAVDGYGETPLNLWGNHYWMLDVEMNCSQAIPDANGNRWFELKSYISNGPGWEPDIRQAGAPYISGNHFAQCGKINMFSRGSASYQILDFP